MAKKILTPLQKAFINWFAQTPALNKIFYLSGGTALAAYYLKHRYSEDLDFFSPKEIDLLALDAFLRKAKQPLRITKFDFQQSFNRNMFFLHTKKEVLKTEFTYFPFEQINKPVKQDGIFIDSIQDIAVNKIFTVYQNPRARDFIDLYFIFKAEKRLTLASLIKNARLKFDAQIDPLQLGAQLLKAKGISDLPRMLKKIAHPQWRGFFLAQAKLLSPKILV